MARAALGEELENLEASARAAFDVPAKIRRSPAKVAAIVGGAGFLVAGGPKRVFRGAKRVIRGPSAPMPKSMLPDEVEKTLRQLGDDGDKVRGALERDFAAYAKQAKKDRSGLQRLLLVGVARPFILAGGRMASNWLFRNDEAGFQARLAQIKARAERQRAGSDSDTAGSGTAGSGTAGSGTAGSGTAGSGTAGSGQPSPPSGPSPTSPASRPGGTTPSGPSARGTSDPGTNGTTPGS